MATEEDYNLLKQQLNGLWNNDEYCDFTIICGSGGEYKKRVHRAVICTRSEWFKNACESDFEEGQICELELSEDYPAVVHALLEFLYLADYSSETHIGLSNPVFHAEVYGIAERILLDPLKELVIKKMKSSLMDDWSEVSFLDATRIVYDSTYKQDDKLRAMMAATAKEKMITLFSDDKENYRDTLEQLPGLAADLVIKLAKHFYSNSRQYRWIAKCGICGLAQTVGFSVTSPPEGRHSMAADTTSLVFFHQETSGLWWDDEYCDFSIVYGQDAQYTKRVHRNIMCARSEWFRNACKRTFKEGQTGKIELTEDDPLIVEALLEYLYWASYSYETTEMHPLIFHVKVYAIAERILLDPLKEVAIGKATASLNNDWSETAFLQAIRTVYDTTYREDDPLRGLLVRRALEGSQMRPPKLKHKTLMEDYPEFARDLAWKMLEQWRCLERVTDW
ncbi:MAG: hypothetical protein M1831_001858 [Alyxoria varia]|nr:MAG: hypothetical protein M1831_001858 [Alyxoria varia]